MDSDETNKYFKEKALELGVKVPYEFETCAAVSFAEIVANIMVILEPCHPVLKVLLALSGLVSSLII